MTDHATGAQVMGASITAATLALIGLPHLALVWGFVGAGVAAAFARPESPTRAVAVVLASGIAGAAGGSACADYLAGSQQVSGSLLVVCSLIGGFGARPLLGRVIETASDWIARLGGNGGRNGTGGDK